MFVLLGSNGQITSRIARQLLAAGQAVRVLGRSADRLAPLARLGAQVAAGDPADAAYLERAFAGATGVYTMIPPCYDAPRMRAEQDRIGVAIATALGRVRVSRVVNLSSIGAELAQGTGPIEGLHAQERRLDALDGPGLLHLRPGSFMQNLLAAVPVVQAAGIVAGMEAPDAPIPMVAAGDIATVATRELLAPRHTGVLLLHAPRHVTMREAARVLGEAIGRPGLPYVQSDPAEAKAELRAHGFSADAADQLERLARWLSSAPLESTRVAPVELQPTTLETFAREEFATAMARAGAAAA